MNIVGNSIYRPIFSHSIDRSLLHHPVDGYLTDSNENNIRICELRTGELLKIRVHWIPIYV